VAPVATKVPDVEILARQVIQHGFELHNTIGPGLLESAYETFLAASLRDAGYRVEQQLILPATYRGHTIEAAFRIDLLIERTLIVEIKSVEKLAKVHHKQVLTYLRMMQLPLGLLINFGEHLFRDGIHRVIDSRSSYQAPMIRSRAKSE
jgi:GxxExxY protein